VNANRSLVYVIILNWNGWRDTLECLTSCQKIIYPNYRVLVVDNGSTDGSEAVIRERFPDVEMLQTGENLGFAGGCNSGIRYALDRQARYIWLLNNDTVVEPNALQALVSIMEADESIGMTGSKILYHDSPEVIWFAGGIIDWQKGDTGHTGQGETDRGQYDHVREVDYITGCSLMAGRGMIEEVGLMDEQFFLYFEETDWCLRAGKLGYKSVYVPESVIYHKESATTGSRSPLYYYYFVRNRLVFLKMHKMFRNWPLRIIKDLKLVLRICLLEDRKRRKLSALVKAYSHFLKSQTGKRF